MLHGPLTKKLIQFAIPIALSSMLQQLFHAADTSVVGHFADADALAAVGTNGELIALLVSLSAGLSVGANVEIARCIGEKKTSGIQTIIQTSLTFSLIFGCLGAILGQFLAAPVLCAIQTPASVLKPAVSYLRIYFLGYPFLLLYDFGSAILRAKGDSRYPFFALSVSGILNVALNLFFVIVCHLGVSGVAAATGISNIASAFLVLSRIPLQKPGIQKNILIRILRTGIPAAVQGAVFCFANIFIQASVNSLGAIATAGSTIAMNFEYFGYYMITAFGQTATTFTSQNFSAGNPRRCKKILALCLVCSVVFCALITVPLTLWRIPFCRLFSPEPEVINAACTRILLVLVFEPVCGLYEIPAGVLRGIGHSTLPAVFTVIGTCLLRIVWIFTVFSRFHTPQSLFLVFPISWVVTIVLVGSGLFRFLEIRSLP